MKTKKKSGRKKLIWGLAVVAVAAVAFFWMNSGGGSPATAAMAEEIAKTGTLATYYSFSGTVVVNDSQTITCEASATVREVYVQENDLVEKDARLLRLSTGDVIKAGIRGQVTNLPVEQDDEVKAGALLVELVNFEDLSIDIKVDEFDVSAVQIGKSAQVTVSALGLEFESVVTAFNKQATQSGDVSYYVASLSTQGKENLLPGMHVDVKVLNQHAENATLISVSALQFAPDNTAFVMTKGSDGTTKTVPVVVGANDGLTAEIVSGLRSGETVLVPQSAVVTRSAFEPPMGSEMRTMSNGN